MSNHERFVHEENLKRFASRLLVEGEAPQRALLQRLLIEEEDRFGSILERLDRAEVLVSEAKTRIATLEHDFVQDGSDTARLRASVLASHRDALDIFVAYVEQLRIEADRNSP